MGDHVQLCSLSMTLEIITWPAWERSVLSVSNLACFQLTGINITGSTYRHLGIRYMCLASSLPVDRVIPSREVIKIIVYT